LSLEQLSAAFANLLGAGDDPYQPSAAPAGDALDAAGLAHTDVVAAEARESADADPCEITPRSILEAMLFVGRATNAPLAATEVAALMRGVRPDEIVDLVAELNERYAAHNCPYEIISHEAGYRLTLREEFAGVRELLHGKLQEARLSQAALDVLAIVAYHQPASSEEVAKLRGKPSGAILAQLVRRQLLRLDRPDEPPADKRRRVEYSTTRRFLEFIGIASLDELPRPQDIDRR
jgi:segregation and condensation protein B